VDCGESGAVASAARATGAASACSRSTTRAAAGALIVAVASLAAGATEVRLDGGQADLGHRRAARESTVLPRAEPAPEILGLEPEDLTHALEGEEPFPILRLKPLFGLDEHLAGANVVRHDHCLDIAGIHLVEGSKIVVIEVKSLVNHHWTFLNYHLYQSIVVFITDYCSRTDRTALK